MKKVNQNIKSFTLMSVLVGMVISGLMIGFVYTIYTNLNQMTYNYQSIHTSINAFNMAKADLKREIEISDKIWSYPNGFALEQQNSTIQYYVKENQLIKKQNAAEIVMFENIEAIKLSHTSENNKEVLASIRIDFSVEKQVIPFYIYTIDDLQNKLNLSLIHE